MQTLNTSFLALAVFGLASCGGQQTPTTTDITAQQVEAVEVVETTEDVVVETVDEVVEVVEASAGEALYQTHCASCHWIEAAVEGTPRVAPPIHGVMRHVLDGNLGDETVTQREAVIAFVTSYAITPNAEVALCNGRAIERFGLMPPQGDLVTTEELDLIAQYLFDDVEPMEPHEETGLMPGETAPEATPEADVVPEG